ncbi:MAG: flagellar hook-associated protein FlgL [Pseudobdellovibrio sp.]
MRVTDKMSQNQVLSNIQKNRSELTQLQQQASTGKKLSTPSDDPNGVTKVLTNRTDLKNSEQFDKNINTAKMFLDTTESTLAQLGEALIRTKELAMQGASDTVGESQRSMIGSEIGQIFNSVLEMSNRRVGERFLFGGFKTQASPFNRDGEYQGDDGEIKVQNEKGNFVPMNLTGDRVFLGRAIGKDDYLRQPEETPQSTDELQQYKLSEAEREFQNNQKLEDRVETRGPASVGRVQSMSKADPITGGEGVNIFSLIRSLDIALKTNDKFTIQDALEPLDQALNQINLVRAEIGGRVNQLSATSDSLQKANVDIKTMTSQIEDADLFQTMSDLSKSDTALKGTLETSSRLLNRSLLDFLK